MCILCNSIETNWPPHCLLYTHTPPLRLHFKNSRALTAASPLWLKSSVSSVSAEVITAVDSVGSWLSSLAMTLTRRRSVTLSHAATHRLGRLLGSDTVASTWNRKRAKSQSQWGRCSVKPGTTEKK